MGVMSVMSARTLLIVVLLHCIIRVLTTYHTMIGVAPAVTMLGVEGDGGMSVVQRCSVHCKGVYCRGVFVRVRTTRYGCVLYHTVRSTCHLLPTA